VNQTRYDGFEPS